MIIIWEWTFVRSTTSRKRTCHATYGNGRNMEIFTRINCTPWGLCRTIYKSVWWRWACRGPHKTMREGGSGTQWLSSGILWSSTFYEERAVLSLTSSILAKKRKYMEITSNHYYQYRHHRHHCHHYYSIFIIINIIVLLKPISISQKWKHIL